MVCRGALAATLIVPVVLAFTSNVTAHHSTGLFDGTMVTTVEGQVTRVEWRSPHIYVFVESIDPDGQSVSWRFESVPIPIMVRQGWTKDSLSIGDRITAEGYPIRGSDQRYAWLRKVTKADGTVLDPGSIGSPAPSLEQN